jgi:multiple antibiotic resistance protein
MEPMNDFAKSTALLAVLLNPFLMSVYLLDLIQGLEARRFASVLLRGALIAATVFVACAWGGDAIFEDLLQVRFASFLLFGGLVFLLIGIRFVMHGPQALAELRGGAPEHLAGSVAMPFMIGPGTVSASVLAGARLPFPLAAGSIATSMVICVLGVLGLKVLYDRARTRRAGLVARYVDIVGRISALLIGTIAVEMLLKGAELWLESRQP